MQKLFYHREIKELTCQPRPALQSKTSAWKALGILVLALGFGQGAWAACEAELETYGAAGERWARADNVTTTAEQFKQRFMYEWGNQAPKTKEAKEFLAWEVEIDKLTKSADFFLSNDKTGK